MRKNELQNLSERVLARHISFDGFAEALRNIVDDDTAGDFWHEYREEARCCAHADNFEEEEDGEYLDWFFEHYPQTVAHLLKISSGADHQEVLQP